MYDTPYSALAERVCDHGIRGPDTRRHGPNILASHPNSVARANIRGDASDTNSVVYAIRLKLHTGRNPGK